MKKGRLQAKTVDQILYVLARYREFRISGFGPLASYREAVTKAKNKFKVTYQTIGDACRRRLELENIDQLLNLLRNWYEGNSNELMDLISKYASFEDRKRISVFFSNEGNDVNLEEIEEKFTDENISMRFENQTLKKLSTIAGAQGLSVKEWLRMEIINLADQKILILMREQIENLNPDERNKLLKGIL